MYVCVWPVCIANLNVECKCLPQFISTDTHTDRVRESRRHSVVFIVPFTQNAMQYLEVESKRNPVSMFALFFLFHATHYFLYFALSERPTRLVGIDDGGN